MLLPAWFFKSLSNIHQRAESRPADIELGVYTKKYELNIHLAKY